VSAVPRPGLREASAYASPQPDAPVRLNTNESPYPLPRAVAEELARAVADVPLHRYPDAAATRLREELAALAGWRVAGTWVANGSNEILAQLLLAYGGPGRAAMTFEPTYSVHARLAWLASTGCVDARTSPPWAIGADEIAAARDARPEIVFVCSPNNPTGNAQPVDAIDAIAAALPQSLVIVDEAYVEFGGRSAVALLDDRSNVAVVRTLSKAFALAGARIGYCLASPEIVSDLERVRLPYHLSSLAQAAGLAALRHRAEALAILDAVREQRERLESSLGAIAGVEVYASDANFVLFRPPSRSPAERVWRDLLDRGVLVRDVTRVVPGALRVTAGTPREVDAFLDALREVI
jgi:histidinol-phosphate aminotransferase